MDISTIYHIRIKGQLDPHWADWFDGLTLTHTAAGETILVGPVVDQAALYGLLIKIRDLNLPLLAVNRIESPVEVETKTKGQVGRTGSH